LYFLILQKSRHYSSCGPGFSAAPPWREHFFLVQAVVGGQEV